MRIAFVTWIEDQTHMGHDHVFDGNDIDDDVNQEHTMLVLHWSCVLYAGMNYTVRWLKNSDFDSWWYIMGNIILIF